MSNYKFLLYIFVLSALSILFAVPVVAQNQPVPQPAPPATTSMPTSQDMSKHQVMPNMQPVSMASADHAMAQPMPELQQPEPPPEEDFNDSSLLNPRAIRSIAQNIDWPVVETTGAQFFSPIRVDANVKDKTSQIIEAAQSLCLATAKEYSDFTQKQQNLSSVGGYFSSACEQLREELAREKFLKRPEFVKKLFGVLDKVLAARMDVAYYNLVKSYNLQQTKKVESLQRAYANSLFAKLGISLESSFIVSQILLLVGFILGLVALAKSFFINKF